MDIAIYFDFDVVYFDFDVIYFDFDVIYLILLSFILMTTSLDDCT